MEPHCAPVKCAVATFNDASTEFAFLVTLGANVPLGQNFYLGGRYRLGIISGPESDRGISFGGITTHIFSLVLGYRFGVCAEDSSAHPIP